MNALTPHMGLILAMIYRLYLTKDSRTGVNYNHFIGITHQLETKLTLGK